jgi:hypothetical protein
MRVRRAVSGRTPRRAWWCLAAGLAAFGAARAAEPEKTPVAEVKPVSGELTPADLSQVRGLLERMRLAFLAGDYKRARDLFVARGEAEELQRDRGVQALRREFRAADYTEFEVLEAVLDERVDPARHRLWLRLRAVCADRPGGAIRENRHNDFFLVERQADGSFALVDSPYFDTLGQRQGVGLVADMILTAILVLAGLTFWVWMGYQAFSLRPRSRTWRIVVTLAPVAGAAVFFAVKYLPELFKKREAPAGEPVRAA